MSFFAAAARTVAREVGRSLAATLKSRKAREAAAKLIRTARTKSSQVITDVPFSKIKRTQSGIRKIGVGVVVGLAAEPILSGAITGVGSVLAKRKARLKR